MHSATEVTLSTHFLLPCLVECYSTSSEEGKPRKQHSLEKDMGCNIVQKLNICQKKYNVIKKNYCIQLLPLIFYNTHKPFISLCSTLIKAHLDSEADCWALWCSEDAEQLKRLQRRKRHPRSPNDLRATVEIHEPVGFAERK